MLFYTISLGLSEDKISLGSSVANYIRDNRTTKQTMPRSSISKEEEEEEEEEEEKRVR
jgi:hypothetical protein